MALLAVYRTVIAECESDRMTRPARLRATKTRARQEHARTRYPRQMGMGMREKGRPSNNLVSPVKPTSRSTAEYPVESPVLSLAGRGHPGLSL